MITKLMWQVLRNVWYIRKNKLLLGGDYEKTDCEVCPERQG